MLSRQHHNHPLNIFSLLAIMIIMIGYGIIQNDTSIQSAAVAKTGKTYTAPDKESTSSNTSNTTSSSSSSTASYQQNQSSAYVQLQDQPLYASNVTHNQTAAETLNASSAEQDSEEPSYQISAPEKLKSILEPPPPKLPAAASTEPTLAFDVNIETTANQTSLITLDLTNPTSAAVIIQPVLQEIPLTLPYEERIRALLTEELQAEQSKKKAAFPQKDFPQKLQENLEVLQLLEKEKIKTIYIRKVYHPFQLLTSAAITAVTYTGKRTFGELLRMPALDSFIVPALQQKKVTLEIPSPLSALGREVQFSILADGEKKYNVTLALRPSFGVAFDVDTNANVMDIYLSVPAESEDTKHEYLTEMQIAGEEGIIYYELFGPYLIAGSESALFSQQFRYEPAIISGTKTVTILAFKDGRVVQKIEREADFGEGKI